MGTGLRALDEGRDLDRFTDALDRTAWAHGLSWQQTRQVAGYATLLEVEAGGTIVSEGERDASLCVVLEGELEVVKRDSRGDQRILAKLGRGTSFGEMSLLDGEPRSASVIARTKAILLTISDEALERMVAERPRLGVEVVRRLGRVVSRHLRRTSGALVDALGG